MAQALRYWKNAATVMIAARIGGHRGLISREANQGNPNKLDQVRGATNVDENDGFDYELLMLKRSGKSKFMPSAYVFPGGRIADADCSKKWSDFYQENGIDVKATLPKAEYLAPMLFDDSTQNGVPNDVAFRICAIRETFEESGVLLCRNADNSEETPQIDKSKLTEWRDIVYKDDTKFLDLCKEISVVPDIWNLHQWNDWLTPTNMDEIHSGKRYDTAFYISCIDKAIEPEHDDHEIVYSEWHNPWDVLALFLAQEVWLAPPQIYELARLCHLRGWGDLKKFCGSREAEGMERLLPVRMTCKDGMIATLPGDDLYPEKPDIEGRYPAPIINMTMDESLASTKNLHRFEFRENGCPIRCNVPQKFGHLAPMLDDELIKAFGKPQDRHKKG